MSAVLKDEAKAHVIPRAWLSRLEFSSGDEIELEAVDKVMLVGANNSGKSRTIREIVSKIQGGDEYNDLVVLRELVLEKKGTQEDLYSYVQRFGHKTEAGFVVGDWQVNRNAIQYWNRSYLIAGLSDGFVRNLDAASRLLICNLQMQIGDEDAPSMPQHLLYRDDALMAKISGLFERAFGQGLVINYLGGQHIPIHVGDSPDRSKFPDRATKAYTNEIKKYPALHLQGDGMRSYAGILFQAVVSARDVICIDEPEAFLHPPQARKLGQTLSTEAQGQLFVATHDSDILRGFLEGQKGKVRILRIRREGSVNWVYEASPDAIKKLWETPVLRFSGALDAMFHDQAILCEDDSDCRLFSSVADYMQETQQQTWPDTAYVPTGGKAGMPLAAEILRAVGVPVKVVLDFDAISDGAFLEKLVKAVGGDWPAAKEHWHRVSSAVREGTPPTEATIKVQIRGLLDGVPADKLPKKQDVDDAYKSKSPWSGVKKYGLNGVPNGQARQECESLIDVLQKSGIYLVPSGEIESFCPTQGGHGPKFVTSVLTNVELNSSSLRDLREFTERIHKGSAAPVKSVGKIADRKKGDSTDQTTHDGGGPVLDGNGKVEG
ncbi:ATP-dependent nuclease [Pseudoxanthomonas sp. LARHCG66]